MSKKNQEIETKIENTEKEEKVELTQEQKEEKISNLRIAHKKALDAKDIDAAKRVRRNLRKLGIYLSKERKAAIDALVPSEA